MVLIYVPFPLLSYYGSAVRPLEQIRGLKRTNLPIELYSTFIDDESKKFINFNMNENETIFVKLFDMKLTLKRLVYETMEEFMSLKNIKYILGNKVIYLHFSYKFFTLYLKNQIIDKINKNNSIIFVDVHGITTYEVGKHFQNIMRYIENFLKNTDGIVVSNISIGHVLNKEFGLSDYFVLPDLVDIDYHLQPLLSNSYFLNNDFNICYSGSLTIEQNIDEMTTNIARLLEKCDRCRFTMIGSYSGRSSLGTIKNLLRSNMNKVYLISRVPYTQVHRILSYCDLFITLKKTLIQSNQKLLLYSVFGKPVIAYDSLANRFLKEAYDLPNVFLVNDNIDEIMLRIIDDYNKYTVKDINKFIINYKKRYYFHLISFLKYVLSVINETN
jgi:glycosyltransferase involved in cell wall biosynthesis